MPATEFRAIRPGTPRAPVSRMKSAAVIVVFLFGLGGVAAAKPESVDWSQYLETKSDKPLVVKHTAKEAPAKKVAKAKTKAKPKKRSARAAKTAKKKH
jgi:Zn-dependent protease